MSKVFKITGNFMQDGVWAKPDPSFAGEIVVDDRSNVFYGYCEELYDSVSHLVGYSYFDYNFERKIYDSERLTELNKTRYLIGAIAPNGRNGKDGIAFYKLSNEPGQEPLMYVIPELESNIKGNWAAPSSFTGEFIPVDYARVKIEQDLSAEPEDKERIKAKFDELDASVNQNAKMRGQVQCCIDILINAK